MFVMKILGQEQVQASQDKTLSLQTEEAFLTP